MDKSTALGLCLTEGAFITVGSLPEGKCLTFSGGSFKLCNLDGSEQTAISELPADTTGWSEVEAEEVIIAHKNVSSGNVYFSIEGSEKFLTREANSSLVKVELAA